MQYKALGVMNITPNSFSDGGLNLTDSGFANSLNLFLSENFKALDFGLESTAPKNAGLVDSFLEWERIETLLIPKLISYQKEISQLDTFSLDTYRYENFCKFEKVFRPLFPNLVLVWNDISGVVDEDLVRFFTEFESDIKKGRVMYVASFTYVSERRLASFHMDYVHENSNIVEDFLEFEKKIVELFHVNKIKNALIVDPAFGFSKTYHQNFELLEFIINSYQPIAKSLLIGISKKSFLRERYKILNPEVCSIPMEELLEKSEVIHREYLRRLTEANNLTSRLDNFWLRVHNSCIFK